MPLIQALTGAGAGISNGASVLRVARVMRVLRTARMARLVRLMPELMILIKGLGGFSVGMMSFHLPWVLPVVPFCPILGEGY